MTDYAAGLFEHQYDALPVDLQAQRPQSQGNCMWLCGSLGSARGIGILPMLHGLEAHATLDHRSHAIAL